MSFIIKLGYTSQPANALDKKPTLATSTTGTLRSECDLLNPVIDIDGTNIDAYTGYNYAYIEEFGRYYFIEWESVRNGIMRIKGHVDVLYTYKDKILANSGLILRTASKSYYTKMLDDGCFKVYADDHIVTQKFTGSQFTSGTFILAVAGS